MNRTTITMDAHRPARMKRYAALLLTISLVAIGALTASPKLSVDSISNVKASHHIKDDLTDYNFGQGYIEASTDGGIFNFGTSPYDGSVESLGHGTAQAWFGGNVIGIAAASPSTGGGYWLASNNGVVCNFGAGNEGKHSAPHVTCTS
jgi:hypothetical protein